MGQPKRKIQGCRDFIGGIDELIRLRLGQRDNSIPWTEKELGESIELLKRDLTDEFRKHSGASAAPPISYKGGDA